MRKVCAMFGCVRSSILYQPNPKDDTQIIALLKQLAGKFSSAGYLMLHAKIREQGYIINKKKTYRIYRELQLQLRTKRKKKRYKTRSVLLPATSVNSRWSMDFVADQLENGRRIRVLNVIDDYSRKIIGQLTDISISGRRVAQFLSQCIREQGVAPKQIVCDNGTEFTSKAMHFWSEETKVALGFIQPGKPTQNAFVESFNGKFRNELLNQEYFKNIQDAREKISNYQKYFNEARPHSALKYQSPMQFLGAVG